MPNLWHIEEKYLKKVLFLGGIFALLTATQALWRPLKSAVFFSLVGVSSIPTAKMISLLPVILAVLGYAFLSEYISRERLFVATIGLHAVAGLLASFFLFIYNPATITKSTFGSVATGWVIYALMESFGAFMSMSFWSMAASMVTNHEAKLYYPILVIFSKIGGLSFASLLYLATTAFPTQTHSFVIPSAVMGGAIFLTLSVIVAATMRHFLPHDLLISESELLGRGENSEEAVADKGEKRTNEEKTTQRSRALQMIEGVMMLKIPYVAAIFASVMLYDIVIVIMDYVTNIVVSSKYASAVRVASYYSGYTALMHLVGLAIAIFGTTPLQRKFGVKASLIATPIIAVTCSIAALISGDPTLLLVVLAVMRASNYAIHHPSREALFVPTAPQVRYRAKAWIDSMGSRMAKAIGSAINKGILSGMRGLSAITVLGISAGWFFLAKSLAKKYQRVVREKRIVSEKDPV